MSFSYLYPTFILGVKINVPFKVDGWGKGGIFMTLDGKEKMGKRVLQISTPCSALADK